MSRRRKGARILGPTRERGGWRIRLVRADGSRADRLWPTEEEAKRYRTVLARELEAQLGAEVTLGAALDRYEVEKRAAGNKPSSITTTRFRLERFFGDLTAAVSSLTPARCRERYAAIAGEQATDTHRNTLAEARTFLGWCVGQRYLTRNPLEGVKGQGRRKRGKAQLRIDEARAWLNEALALAEKEPGAVAALCTVLLGMRAGEIVSRQARDLDDGGRLLWIPESKTEAGRRTLEIPELLRPHLLRLAEGREPLELLFGAHWRDWPREWVQKICRAAGVPRVSAHSLRGLHATLALQAGATSHLVAGALGHASDAVTLGSYAAPGAAAVGRQRAALGVLEGGRAGLPAGLPGWDRRSGGKGRSRR